jgi:DNA-binding CsgD family transcriptional regulator/transcriptional regulator with GAF, ATPase, and Fis domain
MNKARAGAFAATVFGSLTLDKHRLSARETEIARAYAEGQTYNGIAVALGLAPSTVRSHLAAIYKKLEISSKLELFKVLNGELTLSPQKADQAAIISELALSLEESLSREKALAEVLGIISRSEGRIDEVIEELLGYALELCDAEFGLLLTYNRDAGFTARFMKGIPQAFQDWWEVRGSYTPSPQTAIGRLEDSLDVVNIPDVRAEPVFRQNDPLRHATASLGGARSFTAIPMLSGKRLIGAFTIYRQQLRPFDERTVQLARCFADQSAIAIENARLVSALRSNTD